MNPNAPTQIEAEDKEVEIQRVTIDADGSVGDAAADMILLLDQLEPIRDQAADQLKARLLQEKVKYGRGKFAEAKLKLQSIPRVPVTKKVLKHLAQKAYAENKPLMDMLLGLGDAIEFKKGKLEELLGVPAVDALCKNGLPKAPAMEVDAIAGGAPTAAEALAKLVALSNRAPKLFKVERRASRKGSGSPIAYVESICV